MAITPQDLVNAERDIEDIGAVVNGSAAASPVTTRMGQQLKTLAKILEDLFGTDIGGPLASALNTRILLLEQTALKEPFANDFEFIAYDTAKAVNSATVKNETDLKLNRAAKATGAEAIAGTDIEKWINPNALQQALNAKIIDVTVPESAVIEALTDLIAGRALADLSNVGLPVVYLRLLTAGGDTVDLSGIINNALTALSAAGGGVLDISGIRGRISSADIIVPRGCAIVGPWRTGGVQGSLNFGAAKGALLIDSARTIRMQGSSAVLGCFLLRYGMTTPTNYRQGFDLVNAMAGTAVTVEGADATVDGNFIGGFEFPINCTGHERPRITNNNIDCRDSIKLDTVYDMAHVRGNQRWSFLTTPQSWTTNHAITGINSNGGLVRIVIGPHLLIAGDKVTVGGGVVGVTIPVARYTIASVDATSITLAGTTFSGAWVSGGTVFINSSRRVGRAYSYQNTTDWPQGSDNFVYGADEAHVVDSSDHGTFINNGADNLVTAADPTPLGFDIRGSANAFVNVAGKAAAQGTAYRINTTAVYERHYTLLGCRAWNSLVNDYDFRSGKISVIGGGIGVNAKGSITSGVERAAFIGVDLEGINFTFGEGAQAKTRFVECPGIVNQMGTTAFNDRVVIRGASQGGQLVLGYGGDTTNVITQGGPSCWFMDVEAGADNSLRFFRQNAGGAVLVAARVDEATGKFNLYGGLRLVQDAAVLEIVDTTPLAVGRGGRVNLIARNDANQVVVYAAVRASVQSGSAGGEAGSLDLYSRLGGALTLRARLDSDGAFQMGASPVTVIDASRLVRLRSYTVATLPSAASLPAGTTAFVSDATATTFASTVAGGGANGVPVYVHANVWKIG